MTGEAAAAGIDAPSPDAARFGLGCAPIGDLYGPVDPQVAIATVLAAIESGATLLDTAPKYGNGLSEQRVGAALAGIDRARVTLSTKVGWLIDGPAAPRPAFGRDDVLRSLESSMRRLGVDRLDIVHVHDPDDHLDEAARHTVPALIELREQGVIAAVGAGMNDDRLLAELVRRTELDRVLIAGRYTLLEQPALATLLPLCAERGVRVVAAGVFNSGLLVDPRPGAPYNYHPVPRDVLQRALKIKDVCAAHGVPLRAAALQFPFRHPAVSTVLFGAANPAEVADNLTLGRFPVPDALWKDLQTAGLLVA